jgi:hypothetical protein
MKIIPSESIIKGAWLHINGTTQADDNCRRIETLIATELQELAKDKSGWDTLYQDPQDGRLWELLYPESELHGGGPPTLQVIELSQAKAKYPDALL